ncbi:IMP dehydrogenase [Candidatus Woesearchaeota archaeon]|nr:IMP dehydrogenase [Candidatus Woesearchaeota archaeon]
MNQISEALSYDDVLIKPKFSTIYSRGDVDTSSFLTKKIKLNMPIVSANMDKVTEAKMAIAMARKGGIGIIHRFLTKEQQVKEVEIVKRSMGFIIEKPYTITADKTLQEVYTLVQGEVGKGVVVVDEQQKVQGIVSARDMIFQDYPQVKVYEVMTRKDDLVTAREGISLEEAQQIMYKHRIEKLPLVDSEGKLKGLVTSKDLVKRIKYPESAKDDKGRLLVGAAIGVRGDYKERTEALLEANCDVMVIDIAHGHSDNVISVIQELRKNFGDIQIVAGNVASAQGAEDLIAAGVDCVKVGVGPGAACTTRLVTGCGVPQLTAVLECGEIAKKYGVPIIADGGIKQSGDMVKAIGAGAETVMIGSMLAGTSQSPGEILLRNGQRIKLYRGMASVDATLARQTKESGFNLAKRTAKEIVAEGVEAVVLFKGDVDDILNQLMGGLRSGMSYVGAKTIKELQEKAEFVKITSAGMRESKPHDIQVHD